MPITKQTIAIVGADNTIGLGIARCIRDDNYRLLLISEDVSAIQPLVEEITQGSVSMDIHARDCQFDACWEADIIIMAIPYSAYKEVSEIIKDVATQKTVISTANTANVGLGEPETRSGKSVAKELQKLLPNSKVIQAFDSVTIDDFEQSVATRNQTDILITGNDDGALETVSELVRKAGFRPVIANRVATRKKEPVESNFS